MEKNRRRLEKFRADEGIWGTAEGVNEGLRKDGKLSAVTLYLDLNKDLQMAVNPRGETSTNVGRASPSEERRGSKESTLIIFNVREEAQCSC